MTTWPIPGCWIAARRPASAFTSARRPAGTPCRQEDINGLLVERARRGQTVVRLKGGDPFVFGRGGEEALELAEAGIRFDIVPGITAAMAAAAYAGIPLTHRGLASTAVLITGHEDPEKGESGVDWQRLAVGADTLAVYMGVKNLRQITARILAAGGPPPLRRPSCAGAP